MRNAISCRRPCFTDLFVLLILALTGCGDDSFGPSVTTYPVKGHILLADGRPLTTGIVSFVPHSESSVQAVGKISGEGDFELTTRYPGDGAVPGSYRIKVEPFVPGDGTAPLPRNKRPRVPNRFLDEDTSKIIVTVKPESNQEITIRLK